MVMYSEAFMRFLINYQKPEYDEKVYKKEISFSGSRGGRRLAEVLITVKK
jgi:hypothetical protein